ncbi:MAG: hypothetical protein IKW82_10420 [Bacteroidales bacterium]|nr:hypothetical protein [Bacteroidales bacterium]
MIEAESIVAKLYYPEYANTFALTYAISCADGNKIAGIPWVSELYDWGKERMKEMEKDHDLKDNEIVAFYGTDDDITYDSLKGNKDRIRLPEYHPRLIFIPYDYSMYDNIYKERMIDPKGIVTSEDLIYIPEIDDFDAFFSERGVSEKLQSDTTSQADTLKKILFDGKPQITDLTNKKYPIQLFYYGAPLTIFYLNLYPKFLPIRIDIALNKKLSGLYDDNAIKKEYYNLFNTYLYLRYGKMIDKKIINSIKEKVQEFFFQVYSDAILDPQLLSDVYRKYKENVPRGLFYTMRSVEDFAKAITLHCAPKIEKIQDEIFLLKGPYGMELEKRFRETLQLFKEFTSESGKSSDWERTKHLKEIKELALGGKAFMIYSFCWNKKNGKTDWNKVFDSKNKDNFELKGTYLHLYKSVVTCLAWRYCLLYFNLGNKPKRLKQKTQYSSFSTLTRPLLIKDFRKHVIPEIDVPCISSNDYIQFKTIEEMIVEALSERIIGGGNSDEKKTEVKGCISYTEFVLNSFVDVSLDNSLKNGDTFCIRIAYEKFRKMVDECSDFDNTTSTLLKKFIPFKVYDY